MPVIYRTDDAERWGTGKGANLTPAEVDGNFWELLGRVLALETGGAAPNGIANIAVTGSQMTVWLDDGTALGPYTLPTAMIRYRGDWVAGAAYAEMDLVAVPEAGLYLVLRDHSATAPFDATAEDAEGNPLYRWLLPMSGRALGDLADVTVATPAAADFLRHNGTSWLNAPLAWGDIPDRPAAFPPDAHTHPSSEVSDFAEALQDGVAGMLVAGTNIALSYDDAAGTLTIDGAAGGGISFLGLTDTPAAYGTAGQVVAVNGTGDGLVFSDPASGGAGALADLSDVTLATPAAAHFLRYNGTSWVNAAVGWADIPDRPASFPPEAHSHAWSDVTGRPAVVDALPGAVGAAGTVMKAQADGTIAWAAADGAAFLTDMVKGALVLPAANISIPATTITPVDFGAAATVYRDTNAFFATGAPSRLTIPAGVSRVRLRFKAQITSSADGAFSGAVEVMFQKNGTDRTFPGTDFSRVEGEAWPDADVETGAIDVTQGDHFEAVVWSSVACTLRANGRCWIELEVLEGSVLDQTVVGVADAPADGSFYGRLDGAWSSLPQGAGSGLDADLLDGQQAAAFAQIDAFNTFTVNQKLRWVDDAVTVGPVLHLERLRTTNAANDALGEVRFNGGNSAGATVGYGGIRSILLDPTSGAETAAFSIFAMQGGSYGVRAYIAGGLYMLGTTDQGLGTINATAVYDDGTLLCAPIEEAVLGSYDPAVWRELAPNDGLEAHETLKARGFRPESADSFAAEVDAQAGIPGYWNRAEWEARIDRRTEDQPDPETGEMVPTVVEDRVSLAERHERALLALDYAALAIRDLALRVQALEAQRSGNG